MATEETTYSLDLADGAYEAEIRAYDELEQFTSANVSVTMDGQAPQSFRIVSPASESVSTSADTTISWEASADAGTGIDHYSLYLNNEEHTEIAFDKVSYELKDLEEGSYDVEIRAYDGSDNETIASAISFTVDTQGPVWVGAVAPSIKDVTFNTVITLGTISWNAVGNTEDLDHYTVHIAAKTAAGMIKMAEAVTETTEIIYTTTVPEVAISDYFKNGKYEGYIVAHDAYGNYSESERFEFEINVPLPTITEVLIDGLRVEKGSRISQLPEIKVIFEEANSDIGIDSESLWVQVDDSQAKSMVLGQASKAQAAGETNIYEASLKLDVLTEGEHSVTVSVSDPAGNQSEQSIAGLIVVASDTLLGQLRGNYPNPFSPSVKGEPTKIAYDLFQDADIEVLIYNVTGRLIRKLSAASGSKTGQVGDGGAQGYNEVTWDGQDESGNIVANGVYIYMLVKQGEKTPLVKGQMAVLD
ncbi:hypothetical protein ACFL5U_00345 [Candidatus Margulisiibacteriota bacterium]